MSARRANANTCWKSFVPFVNSRVDNVLLKIASDLNQPLFQLISASDVSMLNTFLNCHTYLIVNSVEYRLFRGQKYSRIKSGFFYRAV